MWEKLEYLLNLYSKPNLYIGECTACDRVHSKFWSGSFLFFRCPTSLTFLLTLHAMVSYVKGMKWTGEVALRRKVVGERDIRRTRRAEEIPKTETSFIAYFPHTLNLQRGSVCLGYEGSPEQVHDWQVAREFFKKAGPRGSLLPLNLTSPVDQWFNNGGVGVNV